MLTDAQVIAEWKKRRLATWRGIRVAIVLMLAAGAGFGCLLKTPTAEMSATQLAASFLVFLVLALAMVVAILRTNKLYRCPRCNEVPADDGVLLFPKHCPKCNAVLQSSH